MTMTDAGLESRLVATLRAKSAQVDLAPDAFDPHLGRLLIEEPRSRRRLVLAAAAVVVVLVVAIGVTVLLRDEDVGEPAGVPQGPVSQLQVIATPELRFQSEVFVTEPGRTEIEFWSSGGTHGLQFADPTLATVQLTPPAGKPQRAVVDLVAGRDYTIFCPIPGHRRVGLEAVIRVTDGPPGPTRGPFPRNDAVPTLANGKVDLNQFPDYLLTPRPDGRPGYVKRLDQFSRWNESPPAIYADDLTTVIGHVVSDPLVGVTTTTATGNVP